MPRDVELEPETTTGNWHGSRIEANFNPVNSTISAGKDVNFYNVAAANVTVNKEASIISRLKAALNPVSSASYDSYEANRRTECFPNTRVQVLNDIEAWITAKERQAPIYVLYGVAGIGKSTVAQTIAVKAASQGVLGASFFFSRDEELRKVAKYFFPTIAYQIACHEDAFAHRISNTLDQHPDAPEKMLQQQLSLLLIDSLHDLLSQKTRPMVVVVDAMDECEEERAHELLLLLGANAHRMPGIKFLITTRPEWHLRHALTQDHHHETFRLHEIEESVVHSDIQLYLQFHLSAEEISKTFHTRRTKWEPSASEMEMLSSTCGTLFIIASTMVKFILDRKRSNPQKQLSRLLDGGSAKASTPQKPNNVLDETYIRILYVAQSDLDEDDEDWFQDYQKVLGALITLANPLPCHAMAALLDMDSDSIEATLSQLHSLVAPSGSGDETIFRIHHKSFPDFITDRERIQRALGDCNLPIRPNLVSLLWIDVSEHHLQLAKSCFRVMDWSLKHNVAGISPADWHRDKKDIPDLAPDPISEDLAYAVLHWAFHLMASQKLDKDTELQGYLDTWTSNNVMSWIEVFSVLDRIAGVYGILNDALNSLDNDKATWTRKDMVRSLLSDTYRFIQQGSDIMKLSPMHVYRSCLPFVPKETQLYRTYNTRASLRCIAGIEKTWDHLITTLAGHSRAVYSIAFSSDGAQLASASQDQTVKLWDAKTGAHISTLIGHTRSVYSIAFSPDNSLLASGSRDQTVRLWDSRTGAHISSLVGHSDFVTSVAFSIVDSQIATGSSDCAIRLWYKKEDTYGHTTTLTGHSNEINSIMFSSDGSKLVSGSDDMTVRLWDTNTYAQLKIGICILRLHDPIMESCAPAPSGHLAAISSITLSDDGTRLASASGDCTLFLWDIKSGSHPLHLTGHSAPINLVRFSCDSLLLASRSIDNEVRLWDAKTGDYISGLSIDRVDDVLPVIAAFSTDCSRLAVQDAPNKISLWNISEQNHILSLPNDPGQFVNSLAFSSDDSILASAYNDNTIQLWDTETGTCISTLTGHPNFEFRAIKLSNDGLVMGFKPITDGTIIWLWDPRSLPLTGGPSNRLHHCDYMILSATFMTPQFRPNFAAREELPQAIPPEPQASAQVSDSQPVSLLMLVRRKDPGLTGIVAATTQHMEREWDIVPLCWFPPHIDAICFSVHYPSGMAAIGCLDGRVLLIDLSSNFEKI